MIWNYCIKRPVFTWVIFLIVGIFGIYGWMNLPVREFPDVDFPIASVSVTMRGADPEVIETEIIEPLEEEINTVEGLKELRSTAREQVGTITAEFELWRDIDIAVQDIRDRIERAVRRLPDDADAPIVRKMDPDEQAILWITMLGDENWDMVRLTEYIDDYLQPRLEGIRGVGRIQIGGSQEYAARVRLDPRRLSAHNVTVREVIHQLRENNIKLPMGRIEGAQREFLIISRGMYSDAESLNNLIVAEREGSPVRLSDVGESVQGVRNERSIARYNGEPTVGVGVIRQADANTVEVAATVRERMELLSADFPAGVEYVIASDGSQFIDETIKDLQTTIFIATAIVVFIVLFFLRIFWGTLVVALAIPVSLAAGFGLIYSFGFSMNVLTLLAFILVIGIVVDDAIVILESTYRHIEEGANPIPAARVGTTEVAFAAIANTLALCAVFIPVAFTRGMIGRIFFEFGITAAVTVFASTTVALTLAPMLNSRLLKQPGQKGIISRTIDSFLKKIESIYSFILDWSLKHRFTVIALAFLALALGIFFFLQLPAEFQPNVDTSEFMITFETPQGATLNETDQYVRRVENVLDNTPEVARYFLAVGMGRGAGPGRVNTGMSFVRLVDPHERDDHQQFVMQRLRDNLNKIPGGRSFVRTGGGPGGGGAEIEVAIQHHDLNELAEFNEQLLSWMGDQPEFVGVDSDLEFENPQIEVFFNRDRMAQAGVTVRQISETLNFLMGEPQLSEVERENQRYHVITEVIPRPTAPSVLEDIYVRSRSADLVPLVNFVELEESVGPSEIGRFNRMRASIVSASTPPGVVMGDALNLLENHLAETMPEGFDWETTGTAQMMQESFENLTVSLIFGIIFVYLVMAAQFESWIHPLTILMSLPLAGVGAFGFLYAFGMTFSIFTFIGIIMLVGLVAKNGILLVDFTNVLIARGEKLREAVARAGRVRFRPVIMTAISTILGMMPIALGYGMGGEARAPMGWAVAGGMFSSTVLTLLVIPVVYTLFDDLGKEIKNHGRYMILLSFAILSSLIAAGLFWQSVALFRGGLAGGIAGTVAIVLLIIAATIFYCHRSGYHLLMVISFPGLIISAALFVVGVYLPGYLPPLVEWPTSAAAAFIYCVLGIIMVYIWPQEIEE